MARSSPEGSFSTDPGGARRAAALAVALLAVAACGDGDGSPGDAAGSDPSFRGVSQVAGSDLEAWSLLAVPRDGGTVEARSVRDPARVIWTGETELPPVRSVHLLDGPQVVLRTPGGEVHRYDPRAEELTRLGEVGEEARWAARGRHGVFREPGGKLLHVGPEGAWRYEIDGRPVWSGPVVDAGVAVLVEREGAPPALWLVRRGSSRAENRADSVVRAPVLVTGWGRRLVGVGTDGTSLRFLAVPALTPSGRVALGSGVSALAASPSTHEIYAGVGSPPHVVRVSRFALESRELVDTERAVEGIRPATLGAFLLVHDGGAPLWVPLDGEEARRLWGPWRDDLPMGTPDGRVLLVRDGRLALWTPTRDEAEPVDGPVDRWWGAVRWNPAPPAVVSDRVEGERVAAADTGRSDRAGPSGAAPPPDSLVPERVRPPEGAAGPDTTGRPGGADSLPSGDVTSGYYAVVVAARDADGVRRLLARLSEGGYPTAVQRHRDDAGRLWYRGMVGPYDGREEAEATSRQLRSEHEVDPWVTEIRAGADARDVFP